MDCSVAGYKQSRYEIASEMQSLLMSVGWKKDFVLKSTPIIPISGWNGDNLIEKSKSMAWWKGWEAYTSMRRAVHMDTLQDVFNDFFCVPERPSEAPMRMPISGVYKVKGVGDILAGRVEQGIVKPGEEVVFL